MKESWDKAITFTLSWEGGYSFRSDDPGGETNYGISKRSYPTLDIKSLTKDEAIEIYKRDYWNKVGCDSLPYPLDMIAFDCGVNLGTGIAMAWLKKSDDWRDVLFFRFQYYTDKGKSYPQFLRGWLNRTIGLWKLAKEVL